MTKPLSVSTGRGDLVLHIHEDNITLLNRSSRQELLLTVPGNALFVPQVNGRPVSAERVEIRRSSELVSLHFRAGADDAVEQFTLYIEPSETALDMWVEMQIRHDCQLNALALFPEGTGLHFYDVVNFRNRHYTEHTWPELLVAQNLETSTYSDDWQFAPHPTALILRKNQLSLFAGFMDLQPTFGMRLKVERKIVRRWELDYGPAPHGMQLKAGETFRSGRLRLAATENRSPYEVFTAFGRTLIEKGLIADPAQKMRHAWWDEPIYCTWNDQTLLANHKSEEDLLHQTASKTSRVVSKLTEHMVHRAVNVIRQERLPVRTIILDEGWSVARGDWRPHPDRFPDMRRLVDDLHAQGFKVMVWWSWAEISPEAAIPDWQLAGGGEWRNRHKNRWRDYSSHRVQEGYLKPLMRFLFSSEPGCLDLDGIKTDFLADKIHADTPLSYPSWRGEEVYFRRLTELWYGEMRRHKPDALHLGCSGHYWLAEFTDLNRTYDVHSTNWLEHEERARMLMATAPGVRVSYDMMIFTENTDRYFESARRLNASVEIGNVLVQQDHPFTPVRPADEDLMTLLREGCQSGTISVPACVGG